MRTERLGPHDRLCAFCLFGIERSWRRSYNGKRNFVMNGAPHDLQQGIPHCPDGLHRNSDTRARILLPAVPEVLAPIHRKKTMLNRTTRHISMHVGLVCERRSKLTAESPVEYAVNRT